MEENVFSSGAVAPWLEEHYVEARLHTDGDVRRDEILALQEELTQSVANPYYVILDPPGREPKARQQGASTAETFQSFLEGALAGQESKDAEGTH
jgi:hypothetical protein